ncbi:MAG: hypothetical protein AB3N64_12300 [Puniceicoccaceae bacterium]
MKPILFGALLACLALVVPNSAGALEISDFLEMRGAKIWDLEGTATLPFVSMDLTGFISVEESTSLFEPGAKAWHFLMQVQGGDYVFIQNLRVRMSETDLLMENRVSVVRFMGSVFEYLPETYLAPAALMPRHFELNTNYTYTANLELETITDYVRIGEFEPRTTAQGWEVETVPVTFFADDDQPVTMWMGRNVGFVELQLTLSVGGFLADVELKLIGDEEAWNPQPGTGIWDDSTNLGGGWRESGCIGTIWAPSIDSPWISHVGWGWTYCDGTDDSLYAYAPGVGWLWTQDGMYPNMYVYNRNGWLYYPEVPGSFWFWDYTAREWVVLAPVP